MKYYDKRGFITHMPASEFIRDKNAAWFIKAQQWLNNIKSNGVPKNVKCDCGHPKRDHYQNSGWCHHSEHVKAGQCGCTWYYPNFKYQLKRQLYIKTIALNKRRKTQARVAQW